MVLQMVKNCSIAFITILSSEWRVKPGWHESTDWIEMKRTIFRFSVTHVHVRVKHYFDINVPQLINIFHGPCQICFRTVSTVFQLLKPKRITSDAKKQSIFREQKQQCWANSILYCESNRLNDSVHRRDLCLLNTVEPPVTTTSVERPIFFCLGGRSILFTLILTPPQRQRPLKRVPAAKVTSPQWPDNQRRYRIQTPFCVAKGHETWSVLRVIGQYNGGNKKRCILEGVRGEYSLVMNKEISIGSRLGEGTKEMKNLHGRVLKE